MKKDKKIASIYKILLIFEDMSSLDSNITEREYLSYLDRLFVWSLSWNEEEVSGTIQGLESLGEKAQHKTVRSVVFHMIDLIDRGEDEVIGSPLL